MTDADIYDERYSEAGGGLHSVFDRLPKLVDLLRRYVKYQLDLYHSYLDNIGSRALNRSIYCYSFGEAAYSGVLRIDVGQVQLASEESLYETVAASLLDSLLHISFYVGERFEISVDNSRRLFTGYIEPLRQTESRYAVDDTEVCGLGFSSHIGGNLFDRHFEYTRSCSGVDILPRSEGGEHIAVAAKVCHYTQLYLRVVCREQDTARLGDECFAYLASVVVADGDILQVGIRRAESARRYYRLVERSVYLVCLRVDELGQSLDVGAEQFLESTMFEYQFYYRVAVSELL